MGEMAVLDRTGDTKVTWDKNNPDEVTAAERTFNDLRKKGFVAYKLDDRRGGERKGEVMRSFDAEAERVVLSPAMVGG